MGPRTGLERGVPMFRTVRSKHRAASNGALETPWGLERASNGPRTGRALAEQKLIVDPSLAEQKLIVDPSLADL